MFLLTFIFPLFTLYAQEKSLKGKNVLIVYGGWEGHKPEVMAEKVHQWAKEQGARVIMSDSLGVYTQRDVMKEVDLIVQSWTMGTISPEQSKGLLKAVADGAGIAGCHGGLGDSFRDDTGYQYMVGGQWVAHPGGSVDYTVTITDTDHPVTKGLSDFEIKQTEQYYMHVDPNVNVIATTTFTGEHDFWIDGTTMPAAWTKSYKKGKVFYLSVGHHPRDYDHPMVWAFIKKGLVWAVR